MLLETIVLEILKRIFAQSRPRALYAVDVYQYF